VAKEGDGWLSWMQMSGCVGIIARLLAKPVLWVRIKTSLKNLKWAT
jgi:hypothetical protein